MTKPSELLATATEASRRAGAVLMERFHEQRHIEHKGAIDLLTDADPAAEAAALAVIRSRHPEHAILAEESGSSGRHSAVRWILDPLDGTTNYANDVPQFAVTVACEVDGEVVAGVILDPVRDELFSATAGGGAFRNGKAIRVSEKGKLRDALLSTGFPYWIHDRPEPALSLFGAYLGEARGIRRFGAAALDLAWVACGRFDGFFELGLKPWDIAAGVLIVREAGGVVTSLDDSPLALDGGQILAAAPGLHEEMHGISRRFGPY